MNTRRTLAAVLTGGMTLAGCAQLSNLDLDLRGLGDGFDTSSEARKATANRPTPDSRGVISYPGYQVALAKRGDTVATVASRLGIGAASLARYNGLKADTTLRNGEILALPKRVAEPVFDGPREGDIKVTTLDPIAPSAPASAPAPTSGTSGKEPIRHKVGPGESAFSIARLYGVSAKTLGEWNSLGPDLKVREGQFLLIPVVLSGGAITPATTAAPGAGSQTPTPPSASKPLPRETAAAAAGATATAAAATTTAKPPSPNLGGNTAASGGSGKFTFPAQGSIIRAYKPKVNDGIDIGAAAGSTVRAASGGTVAAITKDTDQVPILVLRHSGNVLTVYANISDISVKKGQKVKRGQSIAKVRSGSPSFLHFEVRKGFESVDPMTYLQ